MTVIMTTDRFWDCECLEAYIHSRDVSECTRCHVRAAEMPDSRFDELFNLNKPNLSADGMIGLGKFLLEIAWSGNTDDIILHFDHGRWNVVKPPIRVALYMEGGVLQGAASNHADLLHLHMWEDGDLIEDYPIDWIPTVGSRNKDSDNSNVRP